MKKLTVFDPAMCCSTGVCGPDPDQALIDFASDFDWLKAHGVPAERWNLANQPMAFVLNHKASAFLKAKGSDALPLILVDNEERLSGRYPTRSELSEWFGIPLTACERARELEKTTGISSAAVCGPDCGCGGKAKPASEPTLKETVDGLKFLENAPHTLFFTGKGGVGKTSVAAASAVALAGLGKRVLLVSTDPASNVSQVFGQPIGNQVTGIQSVPGLSAIEIDPQAAAAYREKLIQPIRGLLPDETVASITEQLSGACTTEIAAFDEFTGPGASISTRTRMGPRASGPCQGLINSGANTRPRSGRSQTPRRRASSLSPAPIGRRSGRRRGLLRNSPESGSKISIWC